MKLKDRLGRLGPGPPLSSQERAGSHESASGGATEVEADEGVEAFARLCERMERELGSIRPPSEREDTGSALSQESLQSLPFVEVPHGGGRIWQRLESQDSDGAVGRVLLAGAQTASSAMLSLLALDPSLADCDPSRALYFDTETTGLGGAGTLAFLIGLAWFDDEGVLVLEQLLLREPYEEPAQMARLRALVEKASMLVSFNGKSFDWPLLQSRCVMNRLPLLEKKPHMDLLHIARRLHKRRLSRCRLVDLESEILSFEREGEDIPGADIPPLYGHFLRTGLDETLRRVVDHNAWDVLTMVALVSLYGESLDDLSGTDLLGLTETLTRAKSYEAAAVAVGRAMDESNYTEALTLRARLNKARGDKVRALADFTRLSAEVDDAAVRLELAKLFEHYAKDFGSALAAVEAGTGEGEDATEHRRARLLRRQKKSNSSR